jgi:hypothetical protein
MEKMSEYINVGVCNDAFFSFSVKELLNEEKKNPERIEICQRSVVKEKCNDDDASIV